MEINEVCYSTYTLANSLLFITSSLTATCFAMLDQTCVAQYTKMYNTKILRSITWHNFLRNYRCNFAYYDHSTASYQCSLLY